MVIQWHWYRLSAFFCSSTYSFLKVNTYIYLCSYNNNKYTLPLTHANLFPVCHGYKYAFCFRFSCWQCFVDVWMSLILLLYTNMWGFISRQQRHKITSLVKIAYFHYFRVKVGDQDERWAPHICCVTCSKSLRVWLEGKKAHMSVAVPMVWRERLLTTYQMSISVTKISGFSLKNKGNTAYPHLSSAMRPVKPSKDLHIPLTPAY